MRESSLQGVLNREVLKCVDRKLIAVRGYHGWAGRAEVAIRAKEELAGEPDVYLIEAHSANATTAKLARN
jgi:hypothetical protein